MDLTVAAADSAPIEANGYDRDGRTCPLRFQQQLDRQSNVMERGATDKLSVASSFSCRHNPAMDAETLCLPLS